MNNLIILAKVRQEPFPLKLLLLAADSVHTTYF